MFSDVCLCIKPFRTESTLKLVGLHLMRINNMATHLSYRDFLKKRQEFVSTKTSRDFLKWGSNDKEKNEPIVMECNQLHSNHNYTFFLKL